MQIAPTKQALEDCGFTIDASTKNNRKFVEISGNLGAVLKSMKRSKDKQGGLTGHFKSQLTSDEDIKFKGGTSLDLQRDLEGEKDMRMFQKVRTNLEGTELMQKLRAKLAEAGNGRKRAMSEHDGDWDMSRRWEIQPFATTFKKPMQNRVIDVDIYFSISWQADPAEIDKYGALAWALCDIIETAGVRTRVRWINEVERADSESKMDGQVNILLKRPGEYLAPNMLATVLQANFFRRPGFALIGALSESQGGEPNYGLGSPRYKQAIEFKEGKLTLGPSVTKGYDAQIEAEILKAIV